MFQRFDEAVKNDNNYTALLYCPPGVGKSTAIGLIAEKSEGNTLVLDVDRTIKKTLAKYEVVRDTDKIFIEEVDNINTFDSWTALLAELKDLKENGVLEENNIRTIAVDNISELERCILSSLGMKGKNKGVPAQADYQYMQFKLVNALRFMKSLGVNIIWTAWEDVRTITQMDGTSYSQIIPKMSLKIVDNICGLCDVVGNIRITKDGDHVVLMKAQQNIYAKNQIDSRAFCKVEDFVKFNEEGKETEE